MLLKEDRERISFEALEVGKIVTKANDNLIELVKDLQNSGKITEAKTLVENLNLIAGKVKVVLLIAEELANKVNDFEQINCNWLWETLDWL